MTTRKGENLQIFLNYSVVFFFLKNILKNKELKNNNDKNHRINNCLAQS